MNGGHRRPAAQAAHAVPSYGPPGIGLLPPPPQFGPQPAQPLRQPQQHYNPQHHPQQAHLQRATNQQQQQHPEMPPNQIAQVIALICGILVVVLMALGLGSADWLMAAGWRQGLFAHCIEPDAPTPLPFNLIEQPGCYRSRDVGYIQAAAGLCIVTLCADVIGTLLTALGLRATDHRVKFKYYRLAVLAMAVALIAILIALVIYPVCFAAELNLGNRTVWEFGWAYGVGWGAAIFLFGAVILLLCDKESEEIYYKERKVEREPPGGP